MIIYITKNLINGKIYIGKDTKNNPDYLGSGRLIIKALKKYGKENFIKETIDFSESLDDLNEKEKYWIKFYNCKPPFGYNITDGGEGTLGFTFTEEQKRKIGDLQRGRKSPEHSKRMKDNNPAKREDVRKKISENNCNKRSDVRDRKSKAMKGKSKEYLKGKSRSEETKKKIGDALRGKKREKFSEEWKNKISKALKGKVRGPFSEEHRKKLSEARKNRKSKMKEI
jgi:group I intron endonuclease